MLMLEERLLEERQRLENKNIDFVLIPYTSNSNEKAWENFASAFNNFQQLCGVTGCTYRYRSVQETYFYKTLHKNLCSINLCSLAEFMGMRDILLLDIYNIVHVPAGSRSFLYFNSK